MYSRVYVEITNICNRNCSFCPGTKRETDSMSLEKFSHILESLQGVTKHLYFHIMGEPLIHPNLRQFIKMAKESGFHPMITTNGTLLASHGHELIQEGVYKIASKASILVVLRLWNNGYDNGRNADIERLLHEYFPQDWQYGKRGITIQKNLFLEYGERFSWPDMEAEEEGNNVFCYGLKDHFGILCDETVIPCCLDHEGDLALGNIFVQDLSEILESKRALAMKQGFRNRKAAEELCRKCGYARRFSV